MHATIEVETLDGTLLVGDPATHDFLSDEQLYWLAAFSDVNGTTQLVADFSEPWTAVRERAAAELTRRIPIAFTVLRIPPGRLVAHVQDEPLALDERAHVKHSTRTSVAVKTGSLDISDPFGASSRVSAAPLPSGQYDAYIHVLSARGGPQTVGIYGTQDCPAVIVELRASKGIATPISLVECADASWPTAPAPGRLCRAEVAKIEPPVAVLKLRITDRIQSGYGRIALDSAPDMTRGSGLVVFLREYTGAFWWCEPLSTT